MFIKIGFPCLKVTSLVGRMAVTSNSDVTSCYHVIIISVISQAVELYCIIISDAKDKSDIIPKRLKVIELLSSTDYKLTWDTDIKIKAKSNPWVSITVEPHLSKLLGYPDTCLQTN